MKALITGTAGFIGFHLADRLASEGWDVVGIDNINDYYPASLKYARLEAAGIDTGRMSQGKPSASSKHPSYRFIQMDLCDTAKLEKLFDEEQFDIVVNLAAQAGVRYSIDNPMAYIKSNVEGFVNLLECCRHHAATLKALVYASSSSVYGGNDKVPFEETDRVDSPVSLYAATKKSNELFASVYSKLYGLTCVGLRFFTVYGPWGRPDMAPILFANAIRAGEPIKVFNNGDLSRDFTYIDDIIEGVTRIVNNPPQGPSSQVYNIGCGHPMQLLDFIRTLEEAFGKEAIKKMMPMQPGDVYTTYADTTALQRDYGYSPSTTLKEGIARFAEWHNTYYK